MLREARRLWAHGWAVHWLKARSKEPVKGKWSDPTRGDWDALEREYRQGYGIGVRLGAPSKLNQGGYLCVIDVDLKGAEARHEAEAFAVVDEHFPGLRQTCPIVKTGRGYHLYARTREPLPSGKIKTSHEEVKVYSPGSELNQRQRSKLTEDEIKKGLRVRNAWEVDFMSVGKQVVLPPTLHMDTGVPYLWNKRKFDDGVVLTFVDNARVASTSSGAMGGKKERTVLEDFKATSVDLVGSTLSDHTVNLILTGEGSSGDRSADCFSATLAMLKHKYSELDILSVLTERSYFLGETAYDHRKTSSRANAAAWVADYCLAKAKDLLRADRAFEDAVCVTPLLLTDEEVQAQLTELTRSVDWRDLLLRSGKDGDGPPRPTLENLVLVLRHAVGEDIFKRDLFALRDFYGIDTPWGGQKGDALTDDDAVLIKMWVAENYRFEPAVGVIFEAMAVIAIGNAYHPIKMQYDLLPEWDLVPRLDTWLARHFQAEGPAEYLAQVFRKWMVAAITRIYEPGAKFDWMIIFEGVQDIGKSSFGRLLFGDKYFTDWLPDLADKDSALGLQGIQCVEFGELASLRKNELEVTKAFITRQVDKVRPPYGRKTIESARQCVFFGTTNRDEYLRDDTGNRRFNPVKVGGLDFQALARERDQLFAEALFIYHNRLEGPLYLEGEAKEFAKTIRVEKMVEDEASLMVEDIVKSETHPDGIKMRLPKTGLILNDLFSEQGPLNRWKRDNRHMQLAAKALKLLGYEKTHTKHGKRWAIQVTTQVGMDLVTDEGGLN